MSPAPARAKKYYPNRHTPLTRQEALNVIAFMPFLVASSDQKLLESMVKLRGNRFTRGPLVTIEFEVFIGSRGYKFEAQPFRILREITRVEFKTVAPWAAIGGPKTYYYEIHSD